MNWITVNWINSHFHGYNSGIQSIFLRCRCLCDLFAVTSAHTCILVEELEAIVVECVPRSNRSTLVPFVRSLVVSLTRKLHIFREMEHFRDVSFLSHPLLFISVNIVMATFTTLNQNRRARMEKEKTFASTTIAHIRLCCVYPTNALAVQWQFGDLFKIEWKPFCQRITIYVLFFCISFRFESTVCLFAIPLTHSLTRSIILIL